MSRQVDCLVKSKSRNIFEYILRMKEFDKEYIGKYKDQKAYSYFDSCFCQGDSGKQNK